MEGGRMDMEGGREGGEGEKFGKRLKIFPS